MGAAVLAASVRGAAAPPTSTWVKETVSPQAGVALPLSDAPLVKGCGGGLDRALVTVALELARVLAERGKLPDAQEIEWLQRKAGSPHVWPRTWGAVVEGQLDRKALGKDVVAWLGAHAPRARCGVGSYKGGGKDSLALVMIDPVADLAAIPTQVNTNTWIDVDARLLAGQTEGRVVLLPPTGAPKTILSSVTGSAPHVRAKFLVATAGRHVVQILADDEAGPRPVLEAEVWAAIAPPEQPPSSEVPGEAAGDKEKDPATALFLRLDGARKAEKLPALVRDPSLDKLARAHAEAMRKARLLGHDVGDGDPASRAAASGKKWKVVGENVAKAKTEKAAHRALYASPSHRGNMLETRFTKVGIGVVVDDKTEEMWVTELYGG